MCFCKLVENLKNFQSKQSFQTYQIFTLLCKFETILLFFVVCAYFLWNSENLGPRGNEEPQRAGRARPGAQQEIRKAPKVRKHLAHHQSPSGPYPHVVWCWGKAGATWLGKVGLNLYRNLNHASPCPRGREDTIRKFPRGAVRQCHHPHTHPWI